MLCSLLGSSAKSTQRRLPQISHNVVILTYSPLIEYSVADPYHHRQLRSTLTELELQTHLNWKTLHIHALGNAVCDSSLGHLLSYVNDSRSHIVLRASAVDALANYNHKHVSLISQ